jgi:MinD-like ATPase involved in chromosome partitioning or flagellar assembly
MNDSASPQSEWILQADQSPRAAAQGSCVIAIASGKGGVGKTNITTNLGIALSSRGNRVCIFDADTSLANINIVLGLRPEFTLEHFLENRKALDDIMAEGPRGLKVIPAASGIADYANLSTEKQQKLLGALTQLESQFDYLLIDTAAGIGNDVLSFVESAQHSIIVISPEPTSLTDAFSLIKVLSKRGYKRTIYIIVNMVIDRGNSMEVYNRFEKAVKKYLDIDVHYLGYVALDESIIASIHLQQPVLTAKPEAPASRCFHAIARNLSKQIINSADTPVFSQYWNKQAQTEQGEPQQQYTHDAPTPTPEPQHAFKEESKAILNKCNTLLQEWITHRERYELNEQIQQELHNLSNCLSNSSHAVKLADLIHFSDQVHNRLQKITRQEQPDNQFMNTMINILDYTDSAVDNMPELPATDTMYKLLTQLQHDLSGEIQQPTVSSMPSYEVEPIQIDTTEEQNINQPFSGSASDLQNSICEWLNSDTVSASEAQDFLRSLSDTYIDRFASMPFDLRTIVYRSLETEDFPQLEIRDTAFTLEELYEKRYHSPLRNTRDTVIKLMEDVNGDKARIHELLTLLQSSYKRQFGEELINPLESLCEEIRSGHYDKEDIGAMIDSLKSNFETVTNTPYQDEKDLLLSRSLELIGQISAQEASLREGLQNLSSCFHGTETERKLSLQAPDTIVKTFPSSQDDQ